jgi:hypothetical protein
MKQKSSCRKNRASRFIARFGRAKLVCTGRQQLELVDGSRSEWIEAQEWISLFHHEAILKARAA